MPYTVETINDCTKKLIFNFDDVDLSKQIESAVKEKQKTVSLKGFRKGKAPLSVVEKAYRPQIENDAFSRFVSEEFYKAIQQEDFNAIGYPKFNNTNFNDGKKISFEAIVETFPEIKLKDYSSYKFKKESEEVTKEDIEALKEQYLAPKAEVKEVTDEKVKLEKGHHAVLNFEGEQADGTKPDNMKGEDFLLEIGSNQFIPGFEDGMVGMKKGEKKTISLNFPADYHEESLKGAAVKFHVELLEIKEKITPELTEELAKELGFESIKDFDEKNLARLTKQKQRQSQSKLQEDILKKLVEENKFDIPETLMEQQKKSVEQELGGNLKQQGFTEDMLKTYFEKWASDVESRAEFQVRSGLILENLAKKYEVEASDADLDKKIDEMVAESGMERSQIESYYLSNDNIKSNLKYAIREEKTFAKLIVDMKVS